MAPIMALIPNIFKATSMSLLFVSTAAKLRSLDSKRSWASLPTKTPCCSVFYLNLHQMDKHISQISLLAREGTLSAIAGHYGRFRIEPRQSCSCIIYVLRQSYVSAVLIHVERHTQNTALNAASADSISYRKTPNAELCIRVASMVSPAVFRVSLAPGKAYTRSLLGRPPQHAPPNLRLRFDDLQTTNVAELVEVERSDPHRRCRAVAATIRSCGPIVWPASETCAQRRACTRARAASNGTTSRRRKVFSTDRRRLLARAASDVGR